MFDICAYYNISHDTEDQFGKLVETEVWALCQSILLFFPFIIYFVLGVILSLHLRIHFWFCFCFLGFFLVVFCVFLFFLTSLLEYNGFTTLCWFLLYNKVNQLYVYIYPHIPSLCVSLPPSLPLPSRWTQSTELISLCDAAASL